MNTTFDCGGRVPKKAFLVCISQGCSNNPFCCIEEHCDCANFHIGHRLLLLRDAVDFRNRKINVSEDPSMAQSVTRFFANTIRAVQDVRSRYRNVLQKPQPKSEAQQLSISLLKKLQRRLELPTNELTGKIFSQVYNEVNKPATSPNPYMVSSRVLYETVETEAGYIAACLSNVESLWRCSFKLSNIFKHPDICVDLGETTCNASIGQRKGMILLQPSLKMGVMSTVLVKIHQLGKNIKLGLCEKNRVQQANYEPKWTEPNNGVFLHDNEGYLYFHQFGFQINTGPSSKLRFKTGDEISMTLDSTSGNLIYSCGAEQHVQLTECINCPENSIYFCIWLHDYTNISILNS